VKREKRDERRVIEQLICYLQDKEQAFVVSLQILFFADKSTKTAVARNAILLIAKLAREEDAEIVKLPDEVD
jgi:hypothetical protein